MASPTHTIVGPFGIQTSVLERRLIPPPSRAPLTLPSPGSSTPSNVFPIIRYWDYFDKVLSGPRPVLAPAGMLLADNVLFHELVPLAEATAAPAAAATPQEDTPPTGTADKLQVSDGGTSREIPPARAEEEKAKVAATTAAAAVGAGVLAPTPRRMKIAESLDAFNKRVREDPRVEVLMLPLRDGLSVVRWRSGAYPDGGES